MFHNPEALQKLVDEYFDQDAKQKPTITGLCLHCGFESRQSFYAYELKEEFSYTIKRARLRIENVYEQALFSNHMAGAIFALKNFDWSDKQQVEQSGNVNQEIKVTWEMPKVLSFDALQGSPHNGSVGNENGH